jgi:acyl-[acyl-carrier-protein]-phospholipid O-acyltransferase/long-chain-fatty-acid--[acyl-carrier-protein] ligase
MVSLEVVEKLAVAASPMGQHGATTRADAQRGEAIILFTTDAALSKDRLQEAARAGGLPEIAVPREVRVVEALPLLGTGKVDHVTLKKMAEGV